MRTIEKLIECSNLTSLYGGNRFLLGMLGRPFASLPDPDRCSLVVAHFGSPEALLELGGALLSCGPSGVLVVGVGSQGVGLRLQGGRITGVQASDERSPVLERADAFARIRAGLCPAAGEEIVREARRTVVAETVLEGLRRCGRANADLMWMQGNVEWVGHEIPREDGPSLTTVFMEHARRTDELHRLETRIGSSVQLVVPLSSPPPMLVAPRRDESVSWDFFDNPDAAAVEEWLDARQLFEACDGASTIRQLAERSMLGYFRTLAGLDMLMAREHVALTGVESGARNPLRPDPELVALVADLAHCA